MKKALYVLMFSLALFTIGCGQHHQGPVTEVEVVKQTAKDARLEKFDKQLAEIHDEASAATAITTFADYVEGDGPKAASVRIFSTSLIGRLAKLEVTARRNIVAGVVAASVAEQQGVVTLTKVAAALNSAKDPSWSDVSKADIEYISSGVRSEIPHITPELPTWEGEVAGASVNDKSDIITPTEALVIGYVLASGDDGDAEPGSKASELQNDKVQIFVNEVID